MAHSDRIKIYNNSSPACVSMYIPKDVHADLDTREVVVKPALEGRIVLRAATMMDSKVFKISRAGAVTFSLPNAKDWIGSYRFEKEEDYYILRPEKQTT